MPNDLVKWGRTGNQVEPPLTKRNAGAKAGRPEAAQYANWLWDRLAAGANLDRREDCLLYMPLISSLDIERGVGTATFSRSSTATYVDLAGVVQSAAVDEARFEAEGCLLEADITNQFLHSEDFSNAVWNKTSASISSGATDGPDGGTNSADKLVEDGSNDLHSIDQAPDALPSDNDNATASWFVKQAERRWVRIRMREKDGTPHNVWFDLNDGLIGDQDAGIINAGIRALANGWFRVSASINVGTGGTTRIAILALADANGSAAYQGDGSSGAYVWGGQYENDLSFASSYIPTTTSAVTRGGDVLSVDVSGNIGLQSSPGTALCDVSLLGLQGSGEQSAFRIGGESHREIVAVQPGASNRTYGRWGDAAATSGTVLSAGTTYRLGLVHEGGGDTALWIDGSQDDTTTGSDVSDTLGGDIHIGHSGSGTEELWGYIRNFKVYNRALNDQEMSIA